MSDTDGYVEGEIANSPCGSCGGPMLACFNLALTTGGACCDSCDKHGYQLTDRGRAALEAMDDGWSLSDAEVMHGRQH